MASFRLPGTQCATQAPMIDAGTLCLAASPLPGPVNLVAGSPAAAFDGDARADGVEIVLTPVQLAAIFENGTIEGEGTLGNRLWGGLSIIGGALELVGAGALLLTPEPTMVTKVGGGALGLHGLDTAGAGIRQVISGKSESTYTAEGAKAAAMALGADDKTAGQIGMGVDIGVPLLLGLFGAVRIIAIRKGAISLAAEEAAGGHTILKHVGQTEAQLRARLAAETWVPTASTFHTLQDAQSVVGQALRANRATITAWAQSAQVGGRTRVVFDAGRVVGSGVTRSSNALVRMTRVRVVLKKVATPDRVYFVLTAFPIP
ncbi:hypothetical protein BH11PSE9_BH11PSE9_33390 [soil metagenome]